MPSAKEYERTGNLKESAFSIKILDLNGKATIPLGNTTIILENGLNKSLTQAYRDKKLSNYNVDIAAFAKQTDSGNYQISIEISISHYDSNGKFVQDELNKGVIAFADSSEIGGIGPNSSIEQELVNQKANEVINTVLKIENANLIEDKK